MTGAELAARLGEGWKATIGGGARKGHCHVYKAEYNFVARFANGTNAYSADKPTPDGAVESCLLGARAQARATLRDLDAVLPGISTKPGILGVTVCNNRTYVAWAASNGRSPEDQLEQDRKDWPGGSMTGFVLWGQEQIREYGKVNPGAFMFGRLSDHLAYHDWVQRKFGVKE